MRERERCIQARQSAESGLDAQQRRAQRCADKLRNEREYHKHLQTKFELRAREIHAQREKVEKEKLMLEKEFEKLEQKIVDKDGELKGFIEKARKGPAGSAQDQSLLRQRVAALREENARLASAWQIPSQIPSEIPSENTGNKRHSEASAATRSALQDNLEYLRLTPQPPTSRANGSRPGQSRALRSRRDPGPAWVPFPSR